MQQNHSNSFAQIINEDEIMDGDDKVSSLGDNTETGELGELKQHIDEEMEEIKIEHEFRARRETEQKKRAEKKAEDKRAETSSKSEQFEKEQELKRVTKKKERKELKKRNEGTGRHMPDP